ncbi:MAG: hypothetical protein GQ574_14765 [Crocinitomix sp.]|nr:hypothetical protein [Crocinitomix sp.]
MKSLLMFDTLRGEHSTGLLSVFKGEGEKHFFHNLKEVGTPDRLYEAYPALFDKGVYKSKKPVILLMGHNRFATQGAIDVDGAHPFKFKNLVGAHNGTIAQWSLKDFHGANDFDIDSQILYSELSENGDLGKVWGEFYGAASLTWYDRITGKLNFIRNDQRPMNYCYSTDKKTLFWASEEWMLNIALAYAKVTHTKVMSTDVNTHYEFEVDSGKKVLVETKEVEGRKPYSYHNYQKQTPKPRQNGWPINLVDSNLMNGGKVVRLKLLKKVVGETGVPEFVCDVTGELDDKVLYQLNLSCQFRGSLNKSLEGQIEASIKSGQAYHLACERSIYGNEWKKRIWFNSCALDPLQKPNEEKAKKVETLWQSPFNEMLWKKRFEKTYNICENCFKDISWKDRFIIKAVSKHTCLCEDCAELEVFKHYTN